MERTIAQNQVVNNRSSQMIQPIVVAIHQGKNHPESSRMPHKPLSVRVYRFFFLLWSAFRFFPT